MNIGGISPFTCMYGRTSNILKRFTTNEPATRSSIRPVSESINRPILGLDKACPMSEARRNLLGLRDFLALLEMTSPNGRLF